MNASRRRVVEAPARKERPVLKAIRVVLEPDPEADVSYLAQDDFADRRRAHKRGEFSFVACYAEADVDIHETPQVLRSLGLGGIESDTDEEALADLVAEQWLVLRQVLTAVGVSTAELPVEVDREWIEWRT